MLQDVRYGNKEHPQKIIIFLHGLGSNNQDLISLAPMFTKFMPETLFTSVNAPYFYEYSQLGFQWFSLKDWDEVRMFKEISESCLALKSYINQVADEFSITNNQIFLIGFSQGAMVALHLGLRLEDELGGIIALSGKLIMPELLKDEIKSYPRVMLNHGKLDQVVPYSSMAEAKTYLEEVKIKVSAYSSIGGHTIDESCVKRMIDFLIQ